MREGGEAGGCGVLGAIYTRVREGDCGRGCGDYMYALVRLTSY